MKRTALESDHEKSPVVWNNVCKTLGKDVNIWRDVYKIATVHLKGASDPLKYVYIVNCMAEYAPTKDILESVYNLATDYGAINPDLDEIINRRFGELS